MKLYIKLSAYSVESIKKAIEIIKEAMTSVNSSIKLIPLPTKVKSFDVLKSPHVYKKAMTKFFINKHKLLICIVNPNEKTISALREIKLNPDVGVKIKAK